MKRRPVLTALAAAPLVATRARAAATAPAPPQPQPGARVAWPTVPLVGGGEFGAEDAAARAVVVVFWSTTCAFCRRHNQHVEQLRRAAAGLPLVVLGVARDTDAAAVARYAQREGYGFPITLAAKPMALALSSRNLIPLTVTVDRSGRLVEVIPGEMFEEDVLALAALATKETR